MVFGRMGYSAPEPFLWFGGIHFGGWIVLFLLWSILWKGLALWHAARRGEKWWFGILLVINTMGVLELLYLLLVVQLFATKLKTPKKPQHKIK